MSITWNNYDFVPADFSECLEQGHEVSAYARCATCGKRLPSHRLQVVTVRATSKTDALWRLENKRNQAPAEWLLLEGNR